MTQYIILDYGSVMYPYLRRGEINQTFEWLKRFHNIPIMYNTPSGTATIYGKFTQVFQSDLNYQLGIL